MGIGLPDPHSEDGNANSGGQPARRDTPDVSNSQADLRYARAATEGSGGLLTQRSSNTSIVCRAAQHRPISWQSPPRPSSPSYTPSSASTPSRLDNAPPAELRPPAGSPDNRRPWFPGDRRTAQEVGGHHRGDRLVGGEVVHCLDLLLDMLREADLLQEVLAEPKWADGLADADRCGSSPLFWTHVNP
jgi:hypothetical protein